MFQREREREKSISPCLLNCTPHMFRRRRDKDAKDTDKMDVEDEASAAASATTGDAAAGAEGAAAAADDNDGAKEDKAEEEKAPG